MLGIIIIASVSGGDDNTEAAVEAENSTTKEWVELMRFTGSGEKKSEVFEYKGGKARVRYDFKSGDFGMFVLYVVKEGKDIMETGGIPEVMIDGPEQSESSLSHLRKGNYYLNVSSANGKWDVFVEEYR